MSSHGGILGVVLFSLYYARRHKLSWTNLGDNLVVAVPIGLFLAAVPISSMANFTAESRAFRGRCNSRRSWWRRGNDGVLIHSDEVSARSRSA